ncbi:hypothetical protein NDA12_001503 [Ustilago hordei]|nr:hypothetical protein NDA15_002818 [Ustilago hordei]KAJ1575660.1 hypothetical protein NDA12_001503 [Ustilago hordei]
MGSCFSTTNTFQGEGRTPNEPSPATAASKATAKADTGTRLGGAAPSSSQAATGTAGTSTTDREARAKAAERRMSQQASKGTPASGKLSKQLEQQKNTNPHALAKEQDGPSRVVWD